VSAGDRAFAFFREVDGWYAESAGGILLGPYDTEDALTARVLGYLGSYQQHPDIGPDVPGGGAA
jgi:hypothetical protein